MKSASPASDPPQVATLVAGRNVNMVSGKQLPWGDPFLQRQNEPSIAVSTRNPLHIVAGANDYRTVDMFIPYEEVPGFEAAAARDAWLGLYKSYDGGQSWISTLLPGFPLDNTTQGNTSPLKAYGTAADPVVRAGTNGLFYYAGLGFTRNTKYSSVFVARLIDNNNIEQTSKTADPIKYIGAKIIDTGTTGKFLDKPWLAVDIPRTGAKTVTIQGPGIPAQTFKAGNVYVAYSIFAGQDVANPYSKIYFGRSTDCGVTWDKLIKISESAHVNQGLTIAIAPSTGYIYLAWRRFSHDTQNNCIMSCYSTDGGKNFSKPQAAAFIQGFDQGTTAYSFRTNSYPALTVDHNGVVYLAWSQRGLGPLPQGAARIVVSTSTNGYSWSSPMTVDNHAGPGHQFMPSLSYSAGKVTAAWYDQRADVADSWDNYISDEPSQQKRHTIDVRAAQLDLFAPGWFAPSVQVSRYVHLLDGAGVSHQVQFNPPNFPMFKEGTRPFHGDYIDLAPAPAFVPTATGGWAYNTDGSQSPVFQAAWTDNRNVKLPLNGDWTDYVPPHSIQENQAFQSSTGCRPGQTSMRNQDVYMSSLTQGLIVGSPGNAKPLDALRGTNRHSFVVFVKNMTKEQRRFKLRIVPPSPGWASFKQFSDFPELEVEIAPFSSISRTVYAKSSQRRASFRVNVAEINGPNGGEVSGGLKGNVILNPEIENPEIENPEIENNELHNPEIENPEIENPEIENTDIINPEIENPEIENTDVINPEIENPEIENPEIENPEIENAAFMNPEIENPEIENPEIENGAISDYTWTISNKGNTTSAYTFKMISAGFNGDNYPGFGFQLLIYRIHSTPAATSAPNSCELTQKRQDELIANIVGPGIFINPEIENPEIENPEIENSAVENATFWLAPGDQAYITLRCYDPDAGDNLIFSPTAEHVEGVTTGQAVNSANENDAKPTPPVDSDNTGNPLMVYNESLPIAPLNAPYSTFLVALGGKPHYTWGITSGSLPTGLLFDPSTGEIYGTPTVAGPFTFTVRVTDSTGALASKQLTLLIGASAYTISGTITLGMSGLPHVVMNGFPNYVETDSNGHYATTVSAGWSDTVAPTLSGYNFTPASITYPPVYSNQTTNYTASSIISPAFKLVFNQSPDGGIGGVPWTVQPVVEVQDASGNRVNTDNSTSVTLTIPPGNGILSGTTSITVTNGDAVFSGLSINKGSYSYTLHAASNPPLTPAVSDPFGIEGFWDTANTMGSARLSHTATTLGTDKVLITGGWASPNPLTSVDLYDPGTRTFTALADMAEGRSGHSATPLLDGTVLITGGGDFVNSAILFDPTTKLFTPTGNMNHYRSHHRATLLQNGKVLVTGNSITFQNTAEIYDPLAGTFVETGLMNNFRNMHTSTLLPNGKVLITGGCQDNTSGSGLSTAELYDPATGTFVPLGDMTGGVRWDHQATLLDNGTVLITGGGGASGYNRTAEIYDPTPVLPDHPNGTFRSLGNMLYEHQGHQAALLRDGKVLLIGGNVLSQDNEIYDPEVETFQATAPMSGFRNDGAAAILPDGRVLITGGYSSGGITNTAEVWNPRAPFPTHVISGTIAGVGGVLLNGLPGHPMTNYAGYYEGLVMNGWSGTVTPAKPGYLFNPPSRPYTNVTVAWSGQDYSPVVCTVSTPNTPEGTATGGINLPYTFTTGGATDSLGHPVEYRLEWAPGQYTSWSSSTAISVTYNTIGTYEVRAQARCQVNPSIISTWSSSIEVTIYTSVSTIQGYVTYNAHPVTNMLDALGIEAEIVVTDESSYHRFPSSPSYNATTGFYSIPNIPQGTYGLEVRVEMTPKDGLHLPGDYDGIINNIVVPAGPGIVTQDARVEKLLHLAAPIDNGVLQPWPGPVFDLHISPVLMDWAVLAEAAYYRYRVDQCTSDTYDIIYTTGDLDITPSQVLLTLPSSGPNDHYEFTLNAYNGSGLLVGRLMMEYVSGYGWDYRFRIAAAAGLPEIDVRQDTTSIPDGGSFNFGARPEGSHTNLGFKIENTGTGTLTIDARGRIDITGPDANQFRVDWIPNPTILPGGNTGFKIVFSPTSGGAKTAALSIPNDDANENPYNITLQGTGVRGPGPEMNVLVGNTYIMDGQPYHFGSKPQDRATDLPISIQNTGDSALTLTLPLTVDQSEGNFTVISQPSDSIPAGGSTSLIVRFNPLTLGEKEASIQLPNSDADEGTYLLRLQGTGTTGLVFSDFEGDTVGEPPLTGGANQPEAWGASVSVSVMIVSGAGGIPSQGLQISDSGFQGDGWARYNFGPFDSGVTTIEGICSVNKLALMDICGTSVNTGTSISRVLVNPRYEMYGLYITAMAAHYQPNRPFRFRIQVNMTAKKWSFVIDNELNGFGDDQVINDIDFMNDPSSINSISKFLAQYSGGSTTISGQTIIYDDIFIRHD
jgi:hypothetical protein